MFFGQVYLWVHGASSHRGTPYRRDIAKEQFRPYWQWSPTLGFKICCIRPASCLCIYFVIDHKPLCTERAACWQFLTGVVRLTLSSVLGLVTSSLQANDSIGALWTKSKVLASILVINMHMCRKTSGPTCVGTMPRGCTSDFMTCTGCAAKTSLVLLWPFTSSDIHATFTDFVGNPDPSWSYAQSWKTPGAADYTELESCTNVVWQWSARTMQHSYSDENHAYGHTFEQHTFCCVWTPATLSRTCSYLINSTAQPTNKIARMKTQNTYYIFYIQAFPCLCTIF